MRCEIDRNQAQILVIFCDPGVFLGDSTAGKIESRDLYILGTGGRGGIRTHGGLPHARFRVECLKPDSATLPQNITANVER